MPRKPSSAPSRHQSSRHQPLGTTLILTALAMLAFAANSVLCRAALDGPDIDAASFTALRLVSGALMLWLLLHRKAGAQRLAAAGDWASAGYLYLYAITFSLAYLQLSTGSGALILFGCVQLSMLGVSLLRGERPGGIEWTGLLLAGGGLVYLLWPGLEAPPLGGALLMAVAGIAWGLYSLRGRGAADPLPSTAGNFLRAAPLGLATLLAAGLLDIGPLDVDGANGGGLHASASGAALALASGALTSGLGYAIWYAALRGLGATSAASVQLSVPLIATLGGLLFVGEAIGLRLLLASLLILGGIALVLLGRERHTRG